MQTNLFNYTTLSTRLEKSTRTLFVTLNRPDWNNSFRLEMLFELESLLAWCTTRVEINTIFFDSCTSSFSSGLELNNLATLSANQLDKINTKLHKIIFAMMQLPQTVVIDLGKGTQTIASEFALGADIRIADEEIEMSFNHCRYGLIPAAGGMSMLSTLVSPVFARSWVLTGDAQNSKTLKESGLVQTVYQSESRQEKITEILNKIAAQAPVQRIQAKLGLFESLRNQFENGIVMDRKIAKASMVSEDWKTRKDQFETSSFMPAKSMSYSVKLSLIKSEDITPIEH